MNGVTYINHKGPNNLFNGIVPNHDVAGTDLGSIFNVEYDIVKGAVTTKGYATFFVTPTTPSHTYIQIDNGSGTPNLVEVTGMTTEEIEIHTVGDSTTTPRDLTVEKTVVRLQLSGYTSEIDLPIEVINNSDAVEAISTLIDRSGSRKTLEAMQAESKEITPAQLPPLSVFKSDTAEKVLTEKVSSITYSRIKKGDPRVDRFSTARYPDRDSVEQIAIEYYLTFKHTKAPMAGAKPREIEDTIAIMIDHHNQTLVTMKDAAGNELAYTLLGFGTEKAPVKEGEEAYTEDEVVFLEVINDKSQKQKIYLPAEVKKNPEFIKNLKNLIEMKVELHNIDEVVSTRPTKELSDKLMNKTFDEDRIPDGHLLYKKDDTTYLYLQNVAKTDYLRLMQKDGQSGLYINLDNVVKDSTASPPIVYPDGTTFEIKKFAFTGPSGSEHLQAVVSDGDKLLTVDLPVQKADMTCLLDGSGSLLPPEKIPTDLTYTTVDEKTYPNCENKKATSTKEGEDLSGNFYYEQKATDGSVLQTYHYISFMHYGGYGYTPDHIQLIEKDGKLYGNFNTDPTDPTKVETCLIESVEAGVNPGDVATIVYYAGDPAQKFTGNLPIVNFPVNAATIADLQALCSGTAPSSTRPIEAYQIPTVIHTAVDKNLVVEMPLDGDLKTNNNKARGTVSLIERVDDFLGMTGTRAFSQPIKLPNEKEQKLNTFHSDNVLLTVSFKPAGGTDTTLAKFEVNGAGTGTVLTLAESEAIALGINTLATGTSGGFCTFDVDAIQLSQKAGQDVVIKSGSNDLRLSFSSQGIIATTVDRSSGAVISTVKHPSSETLDIGVSDKFYDSAVKAPPELGCSIERDGSGKIANQDLKDALLESFTREQRARVIDGADPLKPLELADGTKLFSIPYNAGDPPVIDDSTPFLDFMISPDNKLYQYQHRRNETTKSTAGSPTKPGYKEVRQLVFRRNPDTGATSFVSTLAGTPAVSTLGVPLEFNKSFELIDFVDKVKSPTGFSVALTTPSTTKRETVSHSDGIRSIFIDVDSDNSDYGSTLIGDDGVAQLQRGDFTTQTYPAVPTIPDPVKGALDKFEQLENPENRKTGATKEEIKSDEAKEKKPHQLWKGISAETRPVWFALFTLATIFSVFIPFLGIVAGVLLGIIAASDTKIFSDIMVGPSKYRQQYSDKNGRTIERTMNKNKDKINSYNAAIKDVQAKIDKVNADTKLSPSQKAARLAQLNAEKTSYTTYRDDLIKENERLAIDLAVHSDKQLLELKKEKSQLKEKTDKIDNLVSTRGIILSPDAANYSELTGQISEISHILSDKSLKRDRRGVKELLEQQKLYLYADGLKAGTISSLSADEQKEFNKLSKKYDFNQAEFDAMKDLEAKKDLGQISNEELELLKKLRERYGKSPLAALRDWFSGTSERVDRREEEVEAMAERYVEEHPENGWRDFKFEEETNKPQSGATSARTEENPRRKVNTSKGFFTDKGDSGRGGI